VIVHPRPDNATQPSQSANAQMTISAGAGSSRNLEPGRLSFPYERSELEKLALCERQRAWPAGRPSARAMPRLPLRRVSARKGEVAETSAGAQRRRDSRGRRGFNKSPLRRMGVIKIKEPASRDAGST
jgi:hypothetical protein